MAIYFIIFTRFGLVETLCQRLVSVDLLNRVRMSSTDVVANQGHRGSYTWRWLPSSEEKSGPKSVPIEPEVDGNPYDGSEY